MAFTACSGGVERTDAQSYIARSTPAVQIASTSPAASQTSGTSSGVTILESGFRKDLAVAKGTAWIDVSSVADGYVAVAAVSDKRLKFQVICGQITYNYDMKNDGTPSVFPLQSGNGSYRFRVMKNTTEKKYAEIHSVTCTVTLKDQFQPFLHGFVYKKLYDGHEDKKAIDKHDV